MGNRLSSIKLPNNQTYIFKDPDSVSMGITGATVGDVIQVASVDENGAPTSWDFGAGAFYNISFYIDGTGHLIENIGSGATEHDPNFYISNGHLYYGEEE